jgi:hypothetical protein
VTGWTKWVEVSTGNGEGRGGNEWKGRRSAAGLLEGAGYEGVVDEEKEDEGVEVEPSSSYFWLLALVAGGVVVFRRFLFRASCGASGVVVEEDGVAENEDVKERSEDDAGWW